MKKHITFVLAALFAAAVISFGCSDSGDSGEIPNDVGGDYTIKTSTCPFASEGGSFSVKQSESNKESLAISLKTQQKGKAIAGTSVSGLDVYESSAQEQASPDKETTKTSVISASVSAGGGITAQFKYGDTNYDCSGSFKKEDEKKLTDFNCKGGSTSCSFSVEGGGTVSPHLPTCAETGCQEGQECKDDGACVAAEDAKCESPKVEIFDTGKQKKVCVGDSDEITFPDKNLESAVRVSTGKAQGAITFGDVFKKDRVDLSNKNISNLSGMEYFIALVNLDLSRNNISDISPLKGLTKMTWLYLSKNNITNIEALTDMVNLRSLDLMSNSGLIDVSSLEGNPSLEKGGKIYLFGTGFLKDSTAMSTLIELGKKGVCVVVEKDLKGECYKPTLIE